MDEFKKFADDWWDEKGSMRALHAMSGARMAFMKERLVANFGFAKNRLSYFSNKSVLDVGCGGGIASERMAKLGGKVVGIDISEELIKVAKEHSKLNSLKIDYRVCDISKIKKNGEKFDVVTALEVLEHVEDYRVFLKNAFSCVKDNGLVFLSTINRNVYSYFLAIKVAENILNLVPKGTHQWKYFIKPHEINNVAISSNFIVDKLVGLSPYFSLKGLQWKRSSKLIVNYIISLKNNN